MPGLRIPSLQHLARNWRHEPSFIAATLVRLADNPPRFNYNPLFGAVHDLLVMHVPYETVVAGIRRIRRENVRENLLGVLPLIRDHFEGVNPTFCQSVDRRFYPVGRGLMVPFDPPMIYGVGGQLYFPWFSFWRSNPLVSERLSLFVTLVDEVLMQDPDLETARFEILDFSAPAGDEPRDLTLIDAHDIPRVSGERKAEMLDVFADGYFQALGMLAGRTSTNRDKSERDHNPDQPDFPGFPPAG